MSEEEVEKDIAKVLCPIHGIYLDEEGCRKCDQENIRAALNGGLESYR